MEQKDYEVLGMRFTWEEFKVGLWMTLAFLAIIGIGDAIGDFISHIF